MSKIIYNKSTRFFSCIEVKDFSTPIGREKSNEKGHNFGKKYATFKKKALEGDQESIEKYNNATENLNEYKFRKGAADYLTPEDKYIDHPMYDIKEAARRKFEYKKANDNILKRLANKNDILQWANEKKAHKKYLQLTGDNRGSRIKNPNYQFHPMRSFYGKEPRYYDSFGRVQSYSNSNS